MFCQGGQKGWTVNQSVMRKLESPGLFSPGYRNWCCTSRPERCTVHKTQVVCLSHNWRFHLLLPSSRCLFVSYLSASSPELPLEELQLHLDTNSWTQRTKKKKARQVTLRCRSVKSDAEMVKPSFTCNNGRLPVILELNGCAGQNHALVFQSCE